MTDNARPFGGSADHFARLRAVLTEFDLDPSALGAALDGEARAGGDRLRERLERLAAARAQGERIVSLLDLVRDVGDIESGAPDPALCADVAALFDEVAAAAALGAADMRALAARHVARGVAARRGESP